MIFKMGAHVGRQLHLIKKLSLNVIFQITGICSLQANWISQAAAKQRSGRAGRTRPGECYRLYSKVRFQNMTQFATAEILRMPLHVCYYMP